MSEYDAFLAKHGLRESRARICPRVVAGKRCRMDDDDESCICETFLRLLDHGRIWVAGRGQYLLTGEPYLDAYDNDEIDRFRSALGSLSLSLRLAPEESVWSPGHTTMLMVERADSN